MSIESSSVQAVEKFTNFLNAMEVPYMLVGSFSSNYHGLPRSTKDADIVVQFSPSVWEQLSKNLPSGFTLDAQGSFEMVTATRKEIILVEGSLFEIEIFHLSNDPFDQSRFARRMHVDLGRGTRSWVATAEDVIVQKIRWLKNANRSKDYDDVLNVLRRKGDRLDFTYIQDWCEEHGSTELLKKARSEART